MVAVVSVYVDKDVLTEYLVGSIPNEITKRHFITGSPDANIAELYNHVLDTTAARWVLFVHPDVAFSGEAIQSMMRVFEETGSVGVVGLVGTDGKRQVFSHGIKEVTRVISLDSCAAMIDRESGLRFDSKTFDGLHLYVEDLCFLARANGLTSVVVPVDNFFHASVSFKRHGSSWGNYRNYRKRLTDKWEGKFDVPICTT
jgi:hypothetical protein